MDVIKVTKSYAHFSNFRQKTPNKIQRIYDFAISCGALITFIHVSHEFLDFDDRCIESCYRVQGGPEFSVQKSFLKKAK